MSSCSSKQLAAGPQGVNWEGTPTAASLPQSYIFPLPLSLAHARTLQCSFFVFLVFIPSNLRGQGEGKSASGDFLRPPKIRQGLWNVAKQLQGRFRNSLEERGIFNSTRENPSEIRGLVKGSREVC